MGTGKTLMCLTLILATLHQPCQPPNVTLDASIVITDIAEDSYPFEKQNHLRDSLSMEPWELKRPTLQDMCADVLVKNDLSALRNPFLPPHLRHLLIRDAFYYQFPPDDDCIRAAKRKTLRRRTKKVYLANTTLVIVPSILVDQWKREIEKHLQDDVLKVWVATKSELPDITNLIQYDVIIMDVERFGMEETMYRSFADLPDSVLLEARWKRIILGDMFLVD
jgi:hypothetical protein